MDTIVANNVEIVPSVSQLLKALSWIGARVILHLQVPLHDDFHVGRPVDDTVSSCKNIALGAFSIHFEEVKGRSFVDHSIVNSDGLHGVLDNGVIHFRIVNVLFDVILDMRASCELSVLLEDDLLA